MQYSEKDVVVGASVSRIGCSRTEAILRTLDPTETHREVGFNFDQTLSGWLAMLRAN
jgi:hypothetical protein